MRADGVFDAIVERSVFDHAQAIIATRSDRLSDQRMLELLQSILNGRGELSGMIIDEFEGCPSSSAYRSRFGSLLRAYSLVGFAPDRDFRYLETNRKLRQLYPDVIAEAVSGLEAAGGEVVQDPATDLLTINREFTASLVIMRCFHTGAGSQRWKLRLDTALKPDVTVALRMDANNVFAQDYYLLPRLDMRDAVLRLSEHNGLSIDAYRFDDLGPLYRMAARRPLRLAA